MELGFVTKLVNDIRETTLGLKRYLAGTGRSQCQAMDPNVDLCQLDLKLAWGDDPVQPLPLGFDKMAMGVKMMEEKLVTRLQAEAAKGPKRPRMEAAPRTEQASRPPTRIGMMERDFHYSNNDTVMDGEWYRRGGYRGRGGRGGRGRGKLGGGRERRRGFF
jgi:hypothetical protein